MNMEMKHTLKDYHEKCKIFKIKSILMSNNHPLILVLECCTLRKILTRQSLAIKLVVTLDYNQTQ